jgi:hypothetical protein
MHRDTYLWKNAWFWGFFPALFQHLSPSLGLEHLHYRLQRYEALILVQIRLAKEILREQEEVKKHRWNNGRILLKEARGAGRLNQNLKLRVDQ